MKKSKAKGLFALVLTLTLSIFLALSGCGKGTEGKGTEPAGSKGVETVTLDFMYFDDMPAVQKVFNDVIATFESENPNIKINKQVVPIGDQYYGQMDTRIAGKKAPDVVRLEYQRIGKYANAGALLELSSYISKENQDDMFPAFKSAVTFNEKLCGMPHHTDTYALFYNKELLQKAGITVPASIEKAWTWDEFLNVARTVKGKTGVKYPFTYRWVKGSGYYANPLIYMCGASLTNDDATKANMNTPQGVEFFKFLQTWVNDGLVPDVSPNSPDPIDELFTSGATAMIFSGSWMMDYYDKNFKDKWGVTFMVQKDGKTGSTFGGNAIAGLSQTKHPKEAAKFIEYITNAENSKVLCEAAGFLPVRKSLAQGNLKYEKFSEEMNLFAKQSGTVDPNMVKIECHEKFNDINKIICDSIEKIVLKKGEPEQVAKEMDDEINKILSEK